jgi:hypothetical protein
MPQPSIAWICDPFSLSHLPGVVTGFHRRLNVTTGVGSYVEGQQHGFLSWLTLMHKLSSALPFGLFPRFLDTQYLECYGLMCPPFLTLCQ